MAYVHPLTDPQNIRLVNLGPLALIQPLLELLGVAEIFDRHLPSDAEVSHGKVLAILLAARLQNPTPLVNLADWAQEHGVEFLWNVDPQKLNDDRFARALDAFFDKRHDILADITYQVLRLAHVTLDRCHFDTTHLVFYGSYDGSQPRPNSEPDQLLRDIRMSPAHITRGYLTKYKMLQLGITSVADDLGAVPVSGHLFDGNRNGHTGIEQQYHLLRSTLRLPDNMLLVSDRGTCSAKHLATLRQHGHHALCVCPWNDYRALYESKAAELQWQEATYQSREQKRRRSCQSSLPLEDYRIAVVKHELVNPVDQEPFECRVIFVDSSAAAKQNKERREKNVIKIEAGLAAQKAKLEKGHTSTSPASVERAIKTLMGKKDAARHFRWQIVALSVEEREALAEPTKGHRKPTHRLEYSYDASSAEADARHDGLYALVTTAPLSWSGDALFTQYKCQTHVERGHHELKTPLAVTPIFLKKPERVESLVSLLFVALQAQMTLERRARQRVSVEGSEASKRVTAEQLFRSFENCGIQVSQESYGEVVSVGRLSARQREILSLLEMPTPTQILRRTLAPPPVR